MIENQLDHENEYDWNLISQIFFSNSVEYFIVIINVLSKVNFVNSSLKTGIS